MASNIFYRSNRMAYTSCGQKLMFINFVLSLACLISLSTIVLYLTFHKSTNDAPSVEDPWDDHAEIDRICEFDKYPLTPDNGAKYGKLRWVGAIFRHGDRTPIWHLDSDPYKNYDWPEGKEMLTNTGRRRMFCYGAKLRRRYRDYLDTVKTPSVIAFSSWYRRTIETNALVLSGLFPPTKANSWAPTLAIGKQWQAIGIGSTEFERSWMLTDEATCPLADKLHKETPPPPISEENKEFMRKTALLTNSSVDTIDDIYHIYDTLWIERAYFGNDFQEPSWMQELGNNTWDKLREITELSFGRMKDTPDFLRLRTGVFLSHLIEIAANVTSQRDLDPMFHTFSTHDTMIAPILQILDLYKAPPTYGAGIVFELRQTSSKEMIIRLLYSDLIEHTLNEIDLSKSKIFKDKCPSGVCEIKTFSDTLEHLRYPIKLEDIQKECEISKNRDKTVQKRKLKKLLGSSKL